ncbi:MAG: lipoprotein-releasing ABC transporter permease subunit [Xanthomonadales bacterium]|nr:lipoprotein-releasing ABC transporter permease subunit [Xanthomonadales bacterium]MCE7932554.1 lipoprotein-releasing ABC transporter permease subunit [Xanthomonadales bacterium PRO6]
MFHPLALAIGLRYTGAKRRNHFISFISLVSMLGIALGVTALIVVISVMNGFEQELRARILGMVSHATVTAYGENVRDWPKVVEQARADGRVTGAAPYIEREGMLQGRRISGAMIRGVVPELEASVSDVGLKTDVGNFDALTPGSYHIVLGSELAHTLGVTLGDSVTLMAPQMRATPVGVIPQLRRFKVVGLFEVGMYEYDRGYAFVHIEDAGKLFREHGGVTGVRLKLADMFAAWRVAQDLTTRLDGLYAVRDWTQQHSNFFRAVQTEKLVMFIILSLIVAVAAFNLVSTLVMVVTDKQADIAILRTLGASPRLVMKVFMVQGLAVGLVGTLLGLAGGVLIASNIHVIVPFLERTLGFEAMPGDIYYISSVPSQLRWSDVGRIGALSLLFSAVATLYPAWRAARTQPAQALRYE